MAEQNGAAPPESAPSDEGRDPQIEARAREMGWVPKEQFKGPAENWRDAEEFVQRGEEIMPILQANNRKLSTELQTLRQLSAQQAEQLRAANEAIEALRESNAEIAQSRAKVRRTELLAEIRKAREDNDVEREDELTEELATLRQPPASQPGTRRTPPNGAQASNGGSDPTLNPEWKAWAAENPWFGQDEDRTDMATVVANRLRRQNPGLTGRPFLDEVTRQVNAKLGDGGGNREAPARVEGGARSSSSGGGGSGGGKSYADLPPDAKEACDKNEKRLVGPGKAFPDRNAWRKHYVTKYFE